MFFGKVAGCTALGFFLALSASGGQSPISGPKLNWITVQAEDCATNGMLIGPSRKAGDPAAECVGRKGVKLAKTGDYLESRLTSPANSIVIRYCIPDSPSGGGIKASLSLYVNNVFQRKLELSSHYSWLYGVENKPTNNPADGPGRRFFDESRFLLRDMPVGTSLRLQKDNGDDAAYYIIDLVDIEQVPSPLAQPSGSLSIKDFGAVPDDGVDDTAAIESGINKANATGAVLFFPAGTYNTAKKFILDGAKIQGAGMWHTTLLHEKPQGSPEKGVGFKVNARTEIRDLSIFGAGTNRREESGGIDGVFGTGTIIENIWVEHANTGVWTGRDNQPPPMGVVVKNCRFRNTYADGINLCVGTSDSIVEDCHARNTGDDSFVSWSCKFAKNGPNTNNVFRRCLAEVPWRARCFAIFGGNKITMEDCRGSDTLVDSGINISSEFEALPLGEVMIKNMVLERCGGYFWNNRPYGAVFLHADSRDFDGAVVFDNLQVLDSSCFGITVSQGKHAIQNVFFRNCRFDGVEQYGIYVFPTAKGSIQLENTKFNIGDKPLLKNLSPETFSVVNK